MSKSDVFLLIGLGSLTVGLWQVYLPLAPIFVGLILVGMAVAFHEK